MMMVVVVVVTTLESCGELRSLIGNAMQFSAKTVLDDALKSITSRDWKERERERDCLLTCLPTCLLT